MASRFMATQSGDDAEPPTALATLYLEDGSKFVGRSFGSHEAAVDGEVRKKRILCLDDDVQYKISICNSCNLIHFLDRVHFLSY